MAVRNDYDKDAFSSVVRILVKNQMVCSEHDLLLLGEGSVYDVEYVLTLKVLVVLEVLVLVNLIFVLSYGNL